MSSAIDQFVKDVNDKEQEIYLEVERNRAILLEEILKGWKAQTHGKGCEIDLSDSVGTYERTKPEEFAIELNKALPLWTIDFRYVPAHTEPDPTYSSLDTSEWDWKNGRGMLHKAAKLTCVVRESLTGAYSKD